MRLFKTLMAATVLVSMTACLDSDNDSPPIVEADPQFGELRVLHASADAPAVNILANGNVLNGLADVDYQVGSGLFDVAQGVYQVGVEAITAGGNAVVLTQALSVTPDTKHNLVALGKVADGSLAVVPVLAPEMTVATDQVAVQIFHANPDAPMVDIYVTAPGADIAAEQPLATASYLDATGVVTVAAGEYQIRVTPVGTTTVVFDSGTVALPGGEDLFIAAVPNVKPGDSPLQLLVAPASVASFVIDDVNTPAAIRVVHAVADAPAVDVIANDAVTLADNAAYKAFTGYTNVPGATYSVDINAAGTTTAVVDDAAVPLMAGMRYSAVAHNTLANIAVALLNDDVRRVATDAQVRIVHASPTAGAVDIYVTATDDISGATPAFTNVDFTSPMLSETGFVSLAPGEYHVTVTPTGSTDVALATGALDLMGNMIYTAMAVDNEGGGAPVGLILLDDFVAN